MQTPNELKFKCSDDERKQLALAYKNIKVFLENEKEKSLVANKPLLLIISDQHLSKSALIIQTFTLIIAKELGINKLCTELPRDYYWLPENAIKQNGQLRIFAQESGFSIEGSDLSVEQHLAFKKNKVSFAQKNKEREQAFHDSILSHHQDVIGIFGGVHMQSFVDNIFIQSQFHITLLQSQVFTLKDDLFFSYFKLKGLFEEENSESSFITDRLSFCQNIEKVKQIKCNLTTELTVPEIFEEAKKLCANLPLDCPPVLNTNTMFNFFSSAMEVLDEMNPLTWSNKTI